MSARAETPATAVGATAADIARRVRAGEISAAEVVRQHLVHIERVDPALNAWQVVRTERALEEAAALDRRGRRGLANLPLAGVPVGIKDNVPVAGEPMRDGSRATPEAPRSEDHLVVRRIREAGGVVVGLTHVPELCIFGATDGAWGITRNPWDPSRTPGGSSGGSAAAVASAMVPVAHGNDGMGSIRIPGACCGIVGVKPGHDVIPWGEQTSDWLGLAAQGALATTVEDCALLLSVIADRPEWASPAPAEGLRVAVSVRSPAPGGLVDREWRGAARETGRALGSAGFTVRPADPPYSVRRLAPGVWRWFAGAEEDARGLDPSRLERRTLGHARMGRRVRRRRWIRPEQREAFRRALESFFAEHDVLLTPALAQIPIRAVEWGRRSWAANMAANARFAPFCAPWNFAAYPAMTVPVGMHSRGLPLAVQLVGPPGSEPVLLGVARRLEELGPWPRHAPLAGQVPEAAATK